MKKDIFKGITLMNAILCFCVVTIHLTSAPLGELSPGSLWHTIIFVINKSLSFSVPAFIFLSGFKLYNKYGGMKIDLKKFYASRFKKIVIPYIISVLVYFVWFYIKKWVNIKDLPQYIFLGTLVAHFYYIIIAVQLYLIFPLLKFIFNKCANVVLLASFLCTICFQEFIYFNYSDRFMGAYIFYFVLGMVFAKYRCCEKNNKSCILNVATFVIVAMAHLGLSCMAMRGMLIYRYANIVNIIYGTFAITTIYIICSEMGGKYKALSGIAKDLGKISYNVYLYHILLMFMLQSAVYPKFNLTVKDKFIISTVVVYSAIFIYNILQKYLGRSRKNIE